mgnify:FL=1
MNDIVKTNSFNQNLLLDDCALNRIPLGLPGLLSQQASLTRKNQEVLFQMARVKLLIPYTILALLLLPAIAQAQVAVVSITENSDLGPILVDGEGRTLYLTLEDGSEGAGCDEACARYWPRFTSEGLPEASTGVNADLLGLQDMGDGTQQITYNGWPLYYFVHDRGPGVTRGQASADLWYAVSPTGEPVGMALQASDQETSEASDKGAEASAGSEADSMLSGLMDEGETVYSRVCASCHGPAGEGGVGVRLIGNPRLSDAAGIATAVTHGTAYMPALGGQMTAEETAAVLTFIRNAWGNEHGIVPLNIVEEVRE